MDAVVAKVKGHLEDIKTNNKVAVDARTLDQLDTTLCSSLQAQDALMLIATIASILPEIQQDPSQITELAERIASNAPITFQSVISIIPSQAIRDGLQLGLPASINNVSLALLSTVRSEAETTIIANNSELVIALIDLWLRADNSDVGSKAWKVMKRLLGVDDEVPLRVQITTLENIDTSSHLMWRRIIRDPTIYDLFFSFTSLNTLGEPRQSDHRAKGISQMRLMDLVVTFWPVKSLWKSPFPEINKRYDLEEHEGLIHYCLLHMISTSPEDILEKVNLVQSYTNLLKGSAWVEAIGSAPILDFLVKHNIHTNMLGQFFAPRNGDLFQTMAQSYISEYVQTYVSCFPKHFLQDSTQTKDRMLEHIWNTLGSTSPNKWAQRSDPTQILGVVGSLPRQCFFSASYRTPPILLLPLAPANESVLSTLAHIFHGSQSETNPDASNARIEAAGARCLFFQYLGDHPQYFEDIIGHAMLSLIPHIASAALDVLISLATASWSRKELLTEPLSEVPREEQLRALCTYYGNATLPENGIDALLLSPAGNSVIPFLLSSSRHLSGESYPLAQKKFDLITAVSQGVETALVQTSRRDHSAWKLLGVSLKARLQEGPQGHGIEMITANRESNSLDVATMSL